MWKSMTFGSWAMSRTNIGAAGLWTVVSHIGDTGMEHEEVVGLGGVRWLWAVNKKFDG